MNLVLERMPDLSSLSLKAFGTIRRKPKPQVEVPSMSVSLDGIRFDAAKLVAYRRICGFPDAGGVPIPYPQVHAIGVQMHLLTRPEFPLPLVGLVHLKNRITQQRELAPDEPFALQVGVIGSRATEKGLEFDLQTTVTDEHGQVPWTAVATVLHRGKQTSKKKGPPPPVDARLSEYKAVDAPVDIGRRYGRISGDMNPIHLYPLTAKLLGFDRHIAHGMWSMARCCALLQGGLKGPPRELTAAFKLPLFLPARGTLRHGPADGGPGSGSGTGFDFALLGRDSGKTHLTGSLR